MAPQSRRPSTKGSRTASHESDPVLIRSGVKASAEYFGWRSWSFRSTVRAWSTQRQVLGFKRAPDRPDQQRPDQSAAVPLRQRASPDLSLLDLCD